MTKASYRMNVAALWTLAAALFAPLAGVAPAAEPPAKYAASDTLNIGPTASPQAANLLKTLAWEPAAFTVNVHRGVTAVGTASPTDADAIVTFDSPRPRDAAPGTPGTSPGAGVNRVMLEWYQARGEGGALRLNAPAVLVLHILDGSMVLERGMARILSKQGIHAFIMHMPSFGSRRLDHSRLSGPLFFELCGQSVADARRARDAIAALPRVDAERISIQGTSLGGFIAASTASVDAVFDNTFILLAGGNLYNMFTNGQRESRWIRERLEASGVDDAKLRELCDTLELTYLADRLDPARTWLFSAISDQVVPAANARALAAAAKLEPAHHIWLSGDHYTCVLHLPWVMGQIAGKLNAAEEATSHEPQATSGSASSE